MELNEVVAFHQSQLPCTSFSVFEDMRKKGELCDLSITAQSLTFTAHKVIIAGGIPYFRDKFTVSGVETEEKEFFLDDVDPEALESLIHFAYTGKVDISSKNVRSLLVASQFLQLTEVCDACVEFMSQRFRFDDVVQVRAFAHTVGNLSLTESSDRYIRKNFVEFSKTDQFLSLPFPCFKEILSGDDLYVTSEEMVFEVIIKWVKQKPSERHEKLPELLSEVRMIFLSAGYLIERICTEELIQTSRTCMKLIDEVKNYHLLPEVKEPLKTVPRNCNLKKDDLVLKSSLIKYTVQNYNKKENDMPQNCSIKEDDAVQNCSKARNYYAVSQDGNNGIVYCLATGKVASNVQNDPLCFVVAINEKIYMFLKSTIQIFHVKAMKWEVLGCRHINITLVAVPHKNIIYCLCPSNQMRRFDTQQNKWVRRLPIEAYYTDMVLCSLGDSIYATGGCSINSPASYRECISQNVVQKFSPSTGHWCKVSPMLEARAGHGCTSMNGKIYVCGGYGSYYPSSSGKRGMCSAEVYDPLADQWAFISSMSKSRYNLFLLSNDDGMMWAVGGNIEGSKDNLATEKYYAETKFWSPGRDILQDTANKYYCYL